MHGLKSANLAIFQKWQNGKDKSGQMEVFPKQLTGNGNNQLFWIPMSQHVVWNAEL